MKNLLARLLSWFGLYNNQEYEALFQKYKELLRHLQNQIDALLSSVGNLEEHRKDLIIIISALMSSQLQEEVELKLPVLQELYDKGYTVDIAKNESGNIVVKLVITNTEENFNDENMI